MREGNGYWRWEKDGIKIKKEGCRKRTNERKREEEINEEGRVWRRDERERKKPAKTDVIR